MTYSPGTAGVARTGPPTRLLPTQLALPRNLMSIRLAENQLLYRQHRAPAPPSPQPVTIILDTTPPTFGPAGTTLRLAAHLITTTLWDHGQHPALITLTSPATLTELRTPADLIRLWTSAALHDPATALPPALQTAATPGSPSSCSPTTTPPRQPLRPPPGHPAAHHPPPPRKPAPRPRQPLALPPPPHPHPPQLTPTITRLLAPANGNP